jgi:hypothetical protein
MASTTNKNLTKVEIRYVPAAKIGEVFMKATLGLPEAFLPPNEMDLIDMPGMNATRRAPNHPKNLETIYKHFQTISGDSSERPTQLKVRSMATGDAIVIGGVAYYVAATGFVTKTKDGTLVPVTEESVTAAVTK